MSEGSFCLVTLGCKVNQYESQALREAWRAQGFIETDEKGAATVCVNTCAVTANAVADGRAAVRKIHRENPEAEIIVTGCAAEVVGHEFQKLPGVALVVPQKAKACLLCPGEHALTDACAVAESRDAEAVFPPFRITGYDRSRAVLKVQDGCSHRCTYCIVPLTRGISRSRSPEETVAEARRLLEAGFRELVINGINLAQYGRDFSGPHDFWDLIALLEKELAPEWAGRARLRLSSLEPGQLGSKALDVLGGSVMVAPHLHLSLQSGSKNVLRRMGRGHYDPETLHGFFRDLTAVFPRFGLGADMLCGFPGETGEDAEVTENFAAALPFTYAHVFPYSRRPGTPAAAWKEQVPSEVKKERAARLRALFDEKKKDFLRACSKLPEVRVAWENTENACGGLNEFYTECRFVPDMLPASTARGGLVPARPVGVDKDCLLVEAL
ncbi:MiaB/RimO family radical SAM methylthiotransferase [Desulfovibrio sp. OttesenSCG-928-O18]|nr:MiaB/RimO family radical SAM methylthiotransferase [Desulfovibrio sp. OttesenSCG-928-O18]